MDDHRSDSIGENSRGMRTRLLTGILLAWIVFVHLVYYWNFARVYGSPILKRIAPWLPWQ